MDIPALILEILPSLLLLLFLFLFLQSLQTLLMPAPLSQTLPHLQSIIHITGAAHPFQLAVNQLR
jgi:hypothetical protein